MISRSAPARDNTGTDSAPVTLKRSPLAQEQKLRRAAADFESLLISSFWKSMLDTFSSDDDFADPGHATFQDMGIEAMADAMGKAGGLGLGSLLIKHLAPYAQGQKQADVPKQ